jgi:di/tricarboxylate transporter
MSFATVLGGTVTLIGTSTNLVVSGLQQEKYGTSDPSKVFEFFTITPYGVPYAVWGASIHCSRVRAFSCWFFRI